LSQFLYGPFVPVKLTVYAPLGVEHNGATVFFAAKFIREIRVIPYQPGPSAQFTMYNQILSANGAVNCVGERLSL